MHALGERVDLPSQLRATAGGKKLGTYVLPPARFGVYISGAVTKPEGSSFFVVEFQPNHCLGVEHRADAAFSKERVLSRHCSDFVPVAESQGNCKKNCVAHLVVHQQVVENLTIKALTHTRTCNEL